MDGSKYELGKQTSSHEAWGNWHRIDKCGKRSGIRFLSGLGIMRTLALVFQRTVNTYKCVLKCHLTDIYCEKM